MRVLVTGATGFVGQHVVPALLARGHVVTVLARSKIDSREFPWVDLIETVDFDLNAGTASEYPAVDAQALIHLAWGGLPDYRSSIHMERNYPASLGFIRHVIDSGVAQILVTGTCLEYGMSEGCLAEDDVCKPELPYAVAKDTLRRELFALAASAAVNVQWLRLFYMYGKGQAPNSLLSALDRSIENGEEVFNMSGGEQLRDYLPVEQVAKQIACLVEHNEAGGIFNCCSGSPVSVKSLVESHIEARGASIELNLGYYDYPDYEPMAFWGSNLRMKSVLGAELEHINS